eukprot:979817-Pelagomonas_calceolata.AAC.1
MIVKKTGISDIQQQAESAWAACQLRKAMPKSLNSIPVAMASLWLQPQTSEPWHSELRGQMTGG